MTPGKEMRAKLLHNRSDYPEMCVLMFALLTAAVDLWPQFDTDEEVNGGDLVEWYATFWYDAARLLAEIDPSRTPPSTSEEMGS
jgi:hypothetical protein